MKIKRGVKNLIIVLITALCVVLISFLMIFILQKNKKDKPQGYVMDMSSFVTNDGIDYDGLLIYVGELVQDYIDGNVTLEEYSAFAEDLETTINKVKQFAIYSKDALSAWASDVEDGDFADINVKLMEDIDFDGEGFCVRNFAATFDGNGHTIKNVEFNGNDETSQICGDGNSLSSKVYSMFLNLPASATIKNLRLYQCGRINDGGISGATPSGFLSINYTIKNVAGLVGYAQGCKIQNCVIEDFIVDTKDKTEYINVCGVFAAGYAIVENCLVQGMEVEECNETAGIGPLNYRYWCVDGISNMVSYAYDCFSPSKIYGCVINNDSSKILSSTHYDYGLKEYDKKTIYDSISNPREIGYYNHEITTCYITDKNGFAGLDANFWHKSPGDEYNDGWPYLSSFITFNVFEFKLYYSTSGYISVNNKKQEGTVEIKVPKAVTITPAGTQSFSFYGYAIKAVPIDGYKFDSWGNSSSKPTTYVVFLSPENYVFKFATVGGVTPIMYHLMEPENHLSDVGCYFGGTITCSSTTKDGELIITYNVNNTFYVIYELSAKYALEDDGLSTVLSNTKIKNLENNATYIITPVLGRKSYNVVFD